MFAGHFAFAAGVKAREPEIPLWALMLSTQLLDVFFVPLFLSGVETLEPVSGASAYGGAIIHADYTHSLVGALLISVVAGLIAGRFWGRRGAVVIAGVTLSHWVLDLLVHRADLPLLPGNLGNLPTLGLGLWAVPAVSAFLEAALIIVGGLLYFRAATTVGTEAAPGPQRREYARRGAVAAGMTGLLLVLALASSLAGIS